MIIGENTRQQDMEINICKAKQVTNIRSAGADVLRYPSVTNPDDFGACFGIYRT
jgi:predicted membrane GTPase involved in stress response